MVKFGEAVEALREGKLVAREGWNGKGMFVFKQIPSEISSDVIPKMQSLPQDAKNMFIDRKRDKETVENGFDTFYDKHSIFYQNQMVIVKADNTIDSWVPSSSDVFAEDWIIL